MLIRISLYTLFMAAALFASACGDGHGEHCASTEEALCAGTQIRYCDGEHFGEPEDCPENQECMTMNDGVTHCMLSSMMGDADHSTMEAGEEGMEMSMDNIDMGTDMDGM